MKKKNLNWNQVITLSGTLSHKVKAKKKVTQEYFPFLLQWPCQSFVQNVTLLQKKWCAFNHSWCHTLSYYPDSSPAKNSCQNRKTNLSAFMLYTVCTRTLLRNWIISAQCFLWFGSSCKTMTWNTNGVSEFETMKCTVCISFVSGIQSYPP